jgi:hypothetical protein
MSDIGWSGEGGVRRHIDAQSVATVRKLRWLVIASGYIQVIGWLVLGDSQCAKGIRISREVDMVGTKRGGGVKDLGLRDRR